MNVLNFIKSEYFPFKDTHCMIENTDSKIVFKDVYFNEDDELCSGTDDRPLDDYVYHLIITGKFTLIPKDFIPHDDADYWVPNFEINTETHSAVVIAECQHWDNSRGNNLDILFNRAFTSLEQAVEYGKECTKKYNEIMKRSKAIND